MKVKELIEKLQAQALLGERATPESIAQILLDEIERLSARFAPGPRGTRHAQPRHDDAY